MAATASTSHAELIRYRSSSTPLTTARVTVGRSTSALRPSCQVTTAMSASEATFTPSRNAPATGERRNRGTSGPSRRDEHKGGKKNAERRDEPAPQAAEHVA